MSAPVRQRAVLLGLAAEAIVPDVAGCAAALAQGQRAIERFGPKLIARWREWLQPQHRGRQVAALEQLAALPASLARAEALANVARLNPDACADDRACVAGYLALLPRTAQLRLVPDPHSGDLTLPSFLSADDPAVLRDLLPHDAPPWPPNTPLDGTPYTLGEVIRSDADGVIYRASADGRRLALFACLDPALTAHLDGVYLAQLQRLKETLDWPPSLVRLLDFRADARPPWLILDTAAGADLAALADNLRHQTGRAPAADEALPLMRGLAEALAALHEMGLSHGDLRPQSVLVVADGVKIGDLFVAPLRALARHGSASPRDDVRRFGLIWYRLLVGNWDAEPGGLQGLDLPSLQAAILERCLGAEPPADGRTLVEALNPRTPIETHRAAYAEVTAEEVRAARLRRERLLTELREFREACYACDEEDQRTRRFSWRHFLTGSALAALAGVAVVVATAFSLVRLLLALAAAFLVGLALERWLNWRERAQVRRQHDELLGRAARLGEDYADEVAAWGGPDVLRNVEVVREFIAALQLEVGMPA